MPPRHQSNQILPTPIGVGTPRRNTVRLHNDRAQVRMVLHVSDEVRPGIVLVPGQRTDTDEVAGTVNMLCSDRFTDIGEGATYQSTYLDVSRWSAQDVDDPAPRRFPARA